MQIYICPIRTICYGSKDQSCFADIQIYVPCLIQIRPQVTVQADDVFLGYSSGFRVFFIRNLDAPAGIDRKVFCQFSLGFVQLFHDDDIVGILAVSNFDEAVVGCLIIRRRSYRFRSFTIIVSCSITINLTFG